MGSTQAASVTRVLLVEDHLADATLVRAMLKGARFGRYGVTVVATLADAIRNVQAGGVDAALLDLSLPDSFGVETIRAFRLAAPDLPVIVLTGLEDHEVGLEALKEGCQDYLVKGHGDGEVIARAISHSIHRKALEIELLRAKEQYRLLVDALPDAIVVCTGASVTFVNAAARRLGPADHADAMAGSFATLALPRDAPPVRDLVEDVLAGRRPSGQVEARVRGADGRLIDAEILALAVDRDGERAAEVIVRDITARREADHYRYLATSVFEASADAMIVTDARTRVLMVNGAFTDITGYEAEDIIGQTPRVLASGRHPQEFYEAMWRTLLDAGHWRGDIWNRRKNGELYVQQLTISAIRGYEGTVENFVGVFTDVTEQRQREDSVRHRAFHDVLTGLPNRMLLDDRLGQALAVARRRDHGVAVLFVDLDGFKPINDTHGHRIGDEMLRHVGEALQACVRETDTVARIGGDEFVVLLINVVDCDDVKRTADGILKTLGRPVLLDGITASVGCSIGIALFPQDGTDARTLVANADQAMYAAKRAGKGAYCFFAGRSGEG